MNRTAVQIALLLLVLIGGAALLPTAGWLTAFDSSWTTVDEMKAQAAGAPLPQSFTVTVPAHVDAAAFSANLRNALNQRGLTTLTEGGGAAPRVLMTIDRFETSWTPFLATVRATASSVVEGTPGKIPSTHTAEGTCYGLVGRHTCRDAALQGLAQKLAADVPLPTAAMAR